MHYVIGLLTALAGLFWALNSLQRAGVDLNSFNPFTWYRRHQWKQKYGLTPLYNLDEPLEVAALLLLAIATYDGAITRETKNEILKIYTEQFKLGDKLAADLYLASSHLLKNEFDIVANLPRIFTKSKAKFSRAQGESLLQLLEHVAMLDGSVSQDQRAFISGCQSILRL